MFFPLIKSGGGGETQSPASLPLKRFQVAGLGKNPRELLTVRVRNAELDRSVVSVCKAVVLKLPTPLPLNCKLSNPKVLALI